MSDSDNPMLGEDYAAELLKAHQKGFQEASEMYIAKIRRYVEILTNEEGRLSSSTAFDRMHIEMALMYMERDVE